MKKMPDLHLIAAGSLIEFALDKIGIPVGRIRSLYMYPLSFYEFLLAKKKINLIEYLKDHDLDTPIDNLIHNTFLDCLKEYMAVGGMPEVVKNWLNSENFQTVLKIQSDLVDTFIMDFAKYTKKNHIPYVEKIFSSVPRLAGKKFIFTHVDESLRARELKPALELLEKAGIIHKVTHSASNGLPLGAESNPKQFKVIFLDIGLSQRIQGQDASNWILKSEFPAINVGSVAEAFVGQEFLVYQDSFSQLL